MPIKVEPSQTFTRLEKLKPTTLFVTDPDSPSYIWIVPPGGFTFRPSGAAPVYGLRVSSDNKTQATFQTLYRQTPCWPITNMTADITITL